MTSCERVRQIGQELAAGQIGVPPDPAARPVRRTFTAEYRAQIVAEYEAGKDGTQASGPRPGHERARALKHARYALWKNPENLTAKQQTKLDWVAATDPVLHRAYLLKEGLRTVFVLGHSDGPDAGIEALDRWLAWAARSRLEAFVDLGRKIRRHRPQIEAAIREDLSNALVESTNTKIRVLTRVAFGFHSAEALIALAMLSLGGYRPDLPGRTQ